MWRGQGPAGEVRARQIAKAFGQDQQTPIPPGNAAAAAFANSQPFHHRASFEVADDTFEAVRARQRMGRPSASLLGGLDNTISKRATLPMTLDEVEAYEQWRKRHPCVLNNIDRIKALLQGKRLAVFLDYDGTLTPIVSNPDEALLPQQMRDVVKALAKLFPVAIISGRGREKVENFVQLKELYYAGSHGMDIAGPTDTNFGTGVQALDTTFQPAAHFRPLIDQVYQELCRRLAEIPGSSVEHNTFCVSAHFRNCPGECWQDVVNVAEEVVASNPELRITRGRKVVEVRPKVNWHKGTALEHLLGVLGLRGSADVVALYIGDDHTDEDAFRALKESNQGFGILVSTKVKDTAAEYTVRDPTEVQAFLQALVDWGSSEHNGWHAVSSLSQRASQGAPSPGGRVSSGGSAMRSQSAPITSTVVQLASAGLTGTSILHAGPSAPMGAHQKGEQLWAGMAVGAGLVPTAGSDRGSEGEQVLSASVLSDPTQAGSVSHATTLLEEPCVASSISSSDTSAAADADGLFDVVPTSPVLANGKASHVQQQQQPQQQQHLQKHVHSKG